MENRFLKSLFHRIGLLAFNQEAITMEIRFKSNLNRSMEIRFPRIAFPSQQIDGLFTNQKEKEEGAEPANR